MRRKDEAEEAEPELLVLATAGRCVWLGAGASSGVGHLREERRLTTLARLVCQQETELLIVLRVTDRQTFSADLKISGQQ